MKNKKLKKALIIAAVAVFWMGVWLLLSFAVGNELLLPSPISVAVRIGQLAITLDFWKTVLLSLIRIFIGIAVAVAIGILAAATSERFPIVGIAISPIMHVIKSAPVASFIFLILLWINRDNLPGIIAAMIVIPIIWENVSAGIRSADKQLLEMAKIFKFNRKYRLKFVYLPAVKPYLLAGSKSAVGIGWKAGVAAEVLVAPTLSIGKMIFDSKQYMETVDLFAWTAAAVILSVLIERTVRLITSAGKASR